VKDAVSVLTEHLLGDELDSVARACAEALGRIGEPGRDGLVKGLKHEDPAIREASVLALGEMGAAAKPAREALIAVSKNDPDPDVRQAATTVLKKLGE
jgi:HEAT repeat protein